jgi:hypothetical protein
MSRKKNYEGNEVFCFMLVEYRKSPKCSVSPSNRKPQRENQIMNRNTTLRQAKNFLFSLCCVSEAKDWICIATVHFRRINFSTWSRFIQLRIHVSNFTAETSHTNILNGFWWIINKGLGILLFIMLLKQNMMIKTKRMKRKVFSSFATFALMKYYYNHLTTHLLLSISFCHFHVCFRLLVFSINSSSSVFIQSK